MDSTQAAETNGNPNGHNNNNSDSTLQENSNSRRKPAWRNIVENFQPSWFTIVMNTGILGIVYHQLPYQFDGLYIISTIMYIFSIILFIIFAIPTIIRWTVFHKTAVAKTRGNLDETAMLAAPAIAWLVITGLTGLIPSNAYWGGHGFTILAVVMWWFGTAWMVIACIGICIEVAHSTVTDDNNITTSIFLPGVGVATDAVVGALIAGYAFEVSARLAVPMLIMGYFLDGLAIFVSVEIYTIYFHRLMKVGWPEPAKLPGMILLVGPFAQTAAALLLTGYAASTVGDFGGYDKGTFLTTMGGEVASAAGTVLALLLLGHDFFWLTIACAGIAIGAMRKQHSYSLMWWVTLFPIATLTTAFISLATSMNSPTFRALAAGFTVYLTINYLINWGFTIWHTFNGNLLYKPEEDEPSGEKAD